MSFDTELDHMATTNDVPRRDIDNAVFTMRSRVYRDTGKPAKDSDILDALRLGFAAAATARELRAVAK
jgi:hypothetical protein